MAGIGARVGGVTDGTEKSPEVRDRRPQGDDTRVAMEREDCPSPRVATTTSQQDGPPATTCEKRSEAAGKWWPQPPPLWRECSQPAGDRAENTCAARPRAIGTGRRRASVSAPTRRGHERSPERRAPRRDGPDQTRRKPAVCVIRGKNLGMPMVARRATVGYGPPVERHKV